VPLPAGRVRLLLALGIGLTDLCKGHSGSDDELPDGSLIPIAASQIRRYRPRIVAFTSKNAARGYLGREVAYGWQADEEGCTRFFVLTSPSGQAARFWDLAPWRELRRPGRHHFFGHGPTYLRHLWVMFIFWPPCHLHLHVHPKPSGTR
jgi:TDG/mug DNA glycosylase family protein